MSLRKRPAGDGGAIYSGLAGALFFISSLPRQPLDRKWSGSGCCINAATALAVIDSCRKVDGGSGVGGDSVEKHRGRARTRLRGIEKIGANARECAREQISNGPSCDIQWYICASRRDISRGCAHRIGSDRIGAHRHRGDRATR